MALKKRNKLSALMSMLLRYLVFYGLYPLLRLGSGFGLLYPKLKTQGYIIRLNNRLVRMQTGKNKFRNILLLLPHCLQYTECPYKVTFHIENCRRCGKCQLKDLIETAEEFDFDLFIATGGTIARRIVAQNKPELIIAVACERDLFSGIKDSLPLPVHGITNITPHGPCINTRVSMNQVQDALGKFCKQAIAGK